MGIRYGKADVVVAGGGAAGVVAAIAAARATSAEIEVRKQYMSEISFLKRYVPGFENVRIETSGVNVGIRDTRHIMGEYTIKGEDLLEMRSFPDAVAYNLPWVREIPYRCLVPKGLEDLLVCGDCISTIPGSTYMGTHIGSYNNLKDIPSMTSTGQAAGTAAALCVKEGVTPHRLDVELLKQKLREGHALVGLEVIKSYLAKKLPSGKSLAEYYEGERKIQIERWKRLGEL